jgi:hypothetical protein
VAPAIALSVGGAIAVAMGVEDRSRGARRGSRASAVGLAGLLIVAVAQRSDSEPQHPFGATAMASIIGDARAPRPTPLRPDPDETLRRVLANGCPLSQPDRLGLRPRPCCAAREDRPDFRARCAPITAAATPRSSSAPRAGRPVRRALRRRSPQPPGRAPPQTGHGAPPGAMIRRSEEPAAPGTSGHPFSDLRAHARRRSAHPTPCPASRRGS